MNPGDTGSIANVDELFRPPLNEGRGMNPGDTAGCPMSYREHGRRSTKAGA